MRLLRGILKLILILALVAVSVVGVTNAVVVLSSKGEIVDQTTAASFGADCIVVLGASIQEDGTPSTILKDRLDTAIALYDEGVAPKMIMSGDNSTSTYNEVMAMRAYAIAQGVPAEDIFCDHAGVSTYDSMYRLHAIFGVEKVVVVTQTYHLYRALYDANDLGVQAVGVASDVHSYADQSYYDAREIAARTKDFFLVAIKAEPEKLGAAVSLQESGDVTAW